MKNHTKLIDTFTAIDDKKNQYTIQHHQWVIVSESLDQEPELNEGIDLYLHKGHSVKKIDQTNFLITHTNTHIKRVTPA